MPTEHERMAESARQGPVSCAVLTVSDTRTIETDAGGAMIVRLLAQASHTVADRALVPDEPGQIEPKLQDWLANPSIQAVLVTGGTGIARRDTTIEVVRRLLTAELEGYGELFRTLSFAQVGAAAMLSRAVGGLVVRDADAGGETFLFAMPGSVNAVETAMSRLILPQLAHLVWERRR
ncbi:MAG: MogA/MoaB family molybdenum cofactor biosynthesis protein [Phycisphaerales bacterium]|nr:MogA/MoaB family molybdenum cofactor biosynthesis protein [Phycisphaerales bacterium]